MPKTKPYIYCIEAINGNPKKIGWKYIGQSIQNRREYHHFRQLKLNIHDNPKLQSYFNKYGENSLKFSILMECSENELNFWEKWWIKCFNSINNGFNILNGGNNPPIKTKFCRFKNVVSGEIVEFNSIKEFAQIYNVQKTLASEVLNKKKRIVGDWYNPDGFWKPIIYKVLDPNGKIYEIVETKTGEFCKFHNLNSSEFGCLLRKEAESHRGWTRPDSIIKFPSKLEKYK